MVCTGTSCSKRICNNFFSKIFV